MRPLFGLKLLENLKLFIILGLLTLQRHNTIVDENMFKILIMHQVLYWDHQ